MCTLMFLFIYWPSIQVDVAHSLELAQHPVGVAHSSLELNQPLVKSGGKMRSVGIGLIYTEGPTSRQPKAGEGPTWPNANGRWPREAAHSRRNSVQPKIKKKISRSSAEVQIRIARFRSSSSTTELREIL